MAVDWSSRIPESASQGTVWDDGDKHAVLKVATQEQSASSDATKQYKIVRYSVADGSGNFELTDIPSGQYTLVIGSNHSKVPLALGGGFTMPAGKVKAFTFELKAGETFDASTDFGRSTR